MAATIYIDVDDLPGRLGELGAWTRAGDQVLVTRGGSTIFHLLPAVPNGTTPTTDPPLPRRPVGERAGGGLTIGPRFNDPTYWQGTEADGGQS